MTSSSDGEPLKRRVLVRNLPPAARDIHSGGNQQPGGCKISKADIRRWFSIYGPIACVHLSSSTEYGDTRDGLGRRHAFVTFEDESSALACAAAFATLSPNDNTSQNNENSMRHSSSNSDIPPPGISVVMDRYRDGSGHWPSLPLHPIRRETFLRAFGGRSFAGNISGNTGSHGHINHFTQSRTANTSAIGNIATSSSRNSYQLSRGSQIGSASPSHRVVQHLDTELKDNISTIKNGDKVRLESCDIAPYNSTSGSLLLELLDVERYPHIVELIFCHLNATSLRKCRIICHKFKDIVDNFILGNPVIANELLSRWKEANCSVHPVVPTSDLADEHNPESKYRNVLAMKADETEIFIALDNGNVETYDRETLLLTFTIVGKFSVSPTVLDISDDLILVGYTASTFGKHRMMNSSSGSRSSVRPVASGNHMRNGRKGPVLPQNSWWKLFCRRTKQHLRTIEKSHVTRLYAISAAQQKANTETKNASENASAENEASFQAGISDTQMKAAHNNHEDTSCYDYSYSEARLGPHNLIYFHSRLSILSVDCNLTLQKTFEDNVQPDTGKTFLKSNETSNENNQSVCNINQSQNSAIRIVRVASVAEMKNSVIRTFDLDLNIVVVGIKRTVHDALEVPCHSNYILVFRNQENAPSNEDKSNNSNIAIPDIYTSDDDDEDQKLGQRKPLTKKHQVSLHSDNMSAVLKMPLLTGYTPPGKDSDFDDSKCFVDTIQLIYPLCLVQMSNNGGSFEHVSNLGQPYVCVAFVNIQNGTNLKIITFDQTWMRSTLKKFGESKFVPYDSDTTILVTKFNCDHLIAGFGSYSSRNDGCIAIWEMTDLLAFNDKSLEDQGNNIEHSKIISSITARGTSTSSYDLPVYLLDPPTFHWSGWDDHCGGVGVIEIDK